MRDQNCRICGKRLKKNRPRHHGARCPEHHGLIHLSKERQRLSGNPVAREKMRQYHLKRVEHLPMYMRFIRRKHRALLAGVAFTVTFDDLPNPSPKTCPIFGIQLDYKASKIRPNCPSIDRINPKKGYVPGNIAVISFRANCIKSNATSAELRKIADWMDRQK